MKFQQLSFGQIRSMALSTAMAWWSTEGRFASARIAPSPHTAVAPIIRSRVSHYR
jgi:hypothetical protein